MAFGPTALGLEVILYSLNPFGAGSVSVFRTNEAEFVRISAVRNVLEVCDNQSERCTEVVRDSEGPLIKRGSTVVRGEIMKICKN